MRHLIVKNLITMLLFLPAGCALSPQEAAKTKASQDLAFVKIPAGEYLRGSASGMDNEKPPHRVKIRNEFEIGKYEVTQSQWEALMRSNPSRFKGTNLPVEQVSWEDVQLFIRALNALNDGYLYRLPTEAEWEYAARAGTTGDYKKEPFCLGDRN
jgi:formylglycine-generating enzyme required for sulfatase activity